MVAELGDHFVRGTGWQEKRAALRAFFQSAFWERTIVVLILINAVVLGLETSPSVVGQLGGSLRLIDNIIIAIFTVEITLRIIACGRGFWRDGWSVFDFAIVAIALMPATGGFSVLRSLRIIRALRLISTVKSMRRVMGGMLRAIPSMGAVVALLGLIFYVCAVMATKLFGDTFPDWFGTLGLSTYSLFQIMTLESWSMGIVRPVMETYPYAWAFFVPFIMITTFAVVNLLVGLIVNSMQDAHHAEDVERTDTYRDEVLARLAEIERKIEARGG